MNHRIPKGFESAFVKLQAIPNVGKATAVDLVRLRVRGVKDLAGRDPMAMYKRLCRLDGARHDPCVIDVFMAAVDSAKTGSRKPWWAYTAARKRLLGDVSAAAPAKATRSGR
jgi:hypothetical protein